MKRLILCIQWMYALLLRLYPRKFRDEFGNEMQATFGEVIAETIQRSLILGVWFCVRELWEFPANLAREHWRAWNNRQGGMLMTTNTGWVILLNVKALYIKYSPLLILLILPFTMVGCGWFYTITQLQIARARGIYPSAEAAMRAKIAAGYVGIHQIEITYAGTNSFDGSDPHVWFVSAKVWADKRSDGSSVANLTHDYDFPGSFFLHVKEGWVHVPEEALPRLIGFWMKVFGLVGEG